MGDMMTMAKRETLYKMCKEYVEQYEEYKTLMHDIAVHTFWRHNHILEFKIILKEQGINASSEQICKAMDNIVKGDV